jgi:hypothetical protein
MEKDIIQLRELYEQVLILEDSELSRYGFSREFIRALFSKFTIPHDSKFVKLNKIPTTIEFDNYYVVAAKLKGREEGIAVLRDTIYELTDKEFSTSRNFNFTSLKSAVDKSTIYAVVREEEHEKLERDNSYDVDRKDIKSQSFVPLAYEIIKLLQTKFGSKFIKKIESLQEYIYTNIRTFKLTQTVNRGSNRWGRHSDADIQKVIDVLVSLAELKDDMIQHTKEDSNDRNSLYSQVCNDVVKLFLAPYNNEKRSTWHYQNFQDFVTLFNKHPSFVKLAKLFLTALDRFEDEVLYYFHSDYFKDIPFEQHSQKLEELKQKEITDAAYSDIELIDLYNL